MAEGAHSLHRRWSFTVKLPHKSRRMPNGQQWLTTVRPCAIMATVEDVWGVVDAVRKPSRLQQNSDYFLFVDGIAPTWEDVHNADGGKWSVRFEREEAAAFDAAWEEVVMAAVGERCGDDGDALCGAVASTRRTEYRLALWATDANEVLGQALREAAGREPVYTPHQP